MIVMVKQPRFVDDDILFNVKGFYISQKSIDELIEKDPYAKWKLTKFKSKDVSKNISPNLANRPSLRDLNRFNDIAGSIYTKAVEDRNNGMDYEEIIKVIKRRLESDPHSRRTVIRMMNSFAELQASEITGLNVSCLSSIQYMKFNDRLSVKIVFRASDLEYELFYDLVSIYWFFIRPICEYCDITFYSTTTQNMGQLDITLDKIRRITENKNV